VVLRPLGALHREPDRLLIEEMPPALEVRPLLEAIGAGAERVSEIASRVGRPATSLSRPLDRLVRLGLVARDVPSGEAERSSKRSLHRIADPFFRAWFRLVAGHRAALSSGTKRTRLAHLDTRWPQLVARAWEDPCRASVPVLRGSRSLRRLGPWGPASRWRRGDMPEWDVVSASTDRARLLLGEAWWSREPIDARALGRAADQLAARQPPLLEERRHAAVVRVLFVPRLAGTARHAPVGAVHVVTADDVLGLEPRARR
jgi:hypothetical protein